MKTLLTLAICLAAQQIAFSQQKEKDALPARPQRQDLEARLARRIRRHEAR